MPSPGYLDNILGPDIDVYAAGVILSARKALNFVGLTVSEDEENNWTQIALQSAGAATAGSVPSTGGAARRGLFTDGSGALEWVFVANHHVSASAAIAGTKISPDFGAQDVTTTGDIDAAEVTGSVSLAAPYAALGTTPAGSGQLRLPNAGTIESPGGVLVTSDGDYVVIGAYANPGDVIVRVGETESFFVAVDGAVVLEVDANGATVTGALTADELVSSSLSAEEGESLVLDVATGETIAARVDSTAVLTVAGDGVTLTQPLTVATANVSTVQGPNEDTLVINAADGELVTLGVNGTPVVSLQANGVAVAQAFAANAGLTTSDGGNLDIAAEAAKVLSLGIGSTAILELVTTSRVRLFGGKVHVIMGADVQTTDDTVTTLASFVGEAGKGYSVRAYVWSASSTFGAVSSLNCHQASFHDDGSKLAEGVNSPEAVGNTGSATVSVTIDVTGLPGGYSIFVQGQGGSTTTNNWRALMVVTEIAIP